MNRADKRKDEAVGTVAVEIDGQPVTVPKGSTALDALRRAGREVPTACHDPRLNPSGSCRLCLVRIQGQNRLATACALPVHDGMRLEVETPDLREIRAAGLAMHARNYPREYVEKFPEKPFHRLLAEHGLIEATNSAPKPAEIDGSNPYFRFDPSACIECYRCVRICDEVQGSNVWQVLGRGPGLRIVPDADRFSESTCRSCGACVDACPTAALIDKTRSEHGSPTSWTRTTCPYCGVGCELNVGVREERIVQILPVLEAPVSRGHLCVKGRYAFEFVHSPDRVNTPLIRRDGRFEPVTWDEATHFVASEFKRIVGEYGPESVGVLGSARAPNEDNYLAQKFARVVLGTNNVDCCARVCHAPTAAAMKAVLGTGAATNSFDDIEAARTILVVGSNATECHPIVGERILQAKRNGAVLIVIDPRKTDLARVADIHVALRPGTNVPVLNAMAAAIIDAGLWDREFVAHRVSEFEEFSGFVESFAPEKVASIAEVDASVLRLAAETYAEGKPSMCFHGLGMTEHLQGTEGVMALVNLALVTGNIGIAGSGINPLRGQNNVQGSAHMGCEPAHLAGYVPLETGRERAESIWRTTLSRSPGKTLMEMIDAGEAGRFKALWAIGYDVLDTNANAHATRRALERMELVIVQDLFLNETAKACAHVVLPACSSFERDGTFMNAERRVQRVRAALAPIGESRPDWAIIQEVARAMGRAEGFEFSSAEEIWNEVRLLWAPGGGMAYSRLEDGGLQWPCPEESHPGTTVLHRESFPLGPRATLRRIEYIPTPERISDEYPVLLHTGRSLYHFNAGTMTMRTRNRAIRPTDRVDLHPQDFEALGLAEGERIDLRSRFGHATLPAHRSHDVRPGTAFATFHEPEVFLNLATSSIRDRTVGAPEYKVCAVRIEKHLD